MINFNWPQNTSKFSLRYDEILCETYRYYDDNRPEFKVPCAKESLTSWSGLPWCVKTIHYIPIVDVLEWQWWYITTNMWQFFQINLESSNSLKVLLAARLFRINYAYLLCGEFYRCLYSGNHPRAIDSQEFKWLMYCVSRINVNAHTAERLAHIYVSSHKNGQFWCVAFCFGCVISY